MEEDETMGLIPFFVSTTLGTTSCASFDKLPEIGPVCQKFPGVWLHVDAAYAGNAFICPELKYLLKGVEYADSFNTNPNKWLHSKDLSIDYRHWGIPLSRRFRSLKLWFVFRRFGISGLQNYIRHHIKLAKRFEELVIKDKRFEVCNEVKLGMFSSTSTDQLNKQLLLNINESGRLHMVPAQINEKYIIRFCVTDVNAKEADIDFAWQIIKEYAEEVISQNVEKERALISSSNLDAIDEKQLPYSQSTPRPSFGQKLLSSDCLLNISGASGNSSFNQSRETNTVGLRRNFDILKPPLKAEIEELTAETDHLYTEICKLEEHVKRLEKVLKKSQDTEENQGNTACGDAENTLVVRFERTGRGGAQEEVQFRTGLQECAEGAERKIPTEFGKEAGNYKSNISKLTNDNRELKTALEELKERLKEKEEELQDEVYELLERKKKETLAHKRSFFVRMVSDPKIYNPSVARNVPGSRRHLTEDLDDKGSVQPPTRASWVSWPLAFLFQGITEEGSSNDVPIRFFVKGVELISRFRHLDTKVHLKANEKATNGGNGGGNSPSPEGENSKSPRRTPSPSPDKKY
nr:unnamed protein product [Callosobruchus analis]